MDTHTNVSKNLEREALLATLSQIVAMVIEATEAPSVEAVLGKIADTARELLQTKYAAIGVPGHDGKLKHFKVSGLTHPQITAIGEPPKGLGLLGKILSDRQPIRIHNMHEHPDAYGVPPQHPTMTALLGVPIQIGNQLFGSFYLCDRLDGEPFDEHDQWIIEVLAGYAALALAGVEIHEQRSYVRMLEDRDRIRMELHDGVIQSLYALGMTVDLLRKSGTVNTSDLDNVIETLNVIIDDIRRYILELAQPDRTIHTWQHAVQDIMDRLHIPSTLEVIINAPYTVPPFSPSEFEGICLVLNEGISNVIRHAEASQLWVSVTQNEQDYVLEIRDNGIGFDTNGSQEGLGLGNMKKRMRMYDGNLQVRSSRNAGTTLRISIPVNTDK